MMPTLIVRACAPLPCATRAPTRDSASCARRCSLASTWQTRRDHASCASGGGSFAAMGAWRPQMNYDFGELPTARSRRDQVRLASLPPLSLDAL